MSITVKPKDFVPTGSRDSTPPTRLASAFRDTLRQLPWNTTLTVYFEGQRYNVTKELLPCTDSCIGYVATPCK